MQGTCSSSYHVALAYPFLNSNNIAGVIEFGKSRLGCTRFRIGKHGSARKRWVICDILILKN
jgi:hypothetical protein